MAKDVHLSVYDNDTQELQTDFCLILLEGCCSTRIYFGFSAKKMYAEIPPKHIYMFLLETEENHYPKKPCTVINLWDFIQVSLGIWTYLKWLSDKAE